MMQDKKKAMKSREERWIQFNMCRDEKGQAHFPTYTLCDFEMDKSPQKKGH